MQSPASCTAAVSVTYHSMPCPGRSRRRRLLGCASSHTGGVNNLLPAICYVPPVMKGAVYVNALCIHCFTVPFISMSVELTFQKVIEREFPGNLGVRAWCSH